MKSFRLGLFASSAFFSLAAALVAQPLRAEEKAPLSWRVARGQQWRWELRQEKSTEVKAAALMQKQSEMYAFVLRWEFGDTEEQNARIKMLVERVQVKLASGDDALEYDSQSKEPLEGAAELQAAPFVALAGVTFSGKFTARGELSDLEVIDAPPPPPLLGAGGVDRVNQIRSLIFQTFLGQITCTLPEQPIAVGETWTKEQEMPGPMGPAKITTTYQLDAVQPEAGREMALITAKFDPSNVLPPIPPGAKRKTIADEAAQTISFDVQAGRLHDSTLSTKLALEVEAQNEAVEIVISNSLKVTCRDAEEAAKE